jgi:cytochrome c553
MVNAWIDGQAKAFLRIKSGDTLMEIKPPLPVCTRGDAHKSLGCESCHTSWVPQCIGCHNTFDRNAPGYDMLERREKLGSWVEHVGLFMAERPALGIIMEDDGSRRVMTFTPGMVISIDLLSYGASKSGETDVFRRLYAPASAHTTVREGRSCLSCHNDPLAIGYGRGELVYDIQGAGGKWKFRNRFEMNSHDRLPEDAWIGFLAEPQGITTTRTNARPFNLKEQRAILTVGACLVCHTEDSQVMRESLEDFSSLLEKVSNKCVLPDWND